MKTKALFLMIVLVTIVSSCAAPSTPISSPLPPTVNSGSPTAKVEATAPPKPVTIIFWENSNKAEADFYDKEAKLFNEQYPWITIDATHFSDQKAYIETLNLAFQSENAPDVFTRMSRGISMVQMIENNWIQPIDPWITPEWLARFPQDALAEGKTVFDGKIYSSPKNMARRFDLLLYINESMFREAGLVDAAGEIQSPQTWADLRTMSKKITETGKGKYYGIGIGLKNPPEMTWWIDLAMLAGAPGSYEIDYRTGRYTLGTDPAYPQIVELLLGMKDDGSVYPYEGTLSDSTLVTAFGQGKFAMFLSRSYNISNLEKDFPDFHSYRVIAPPIPDEGRKGGFIASPGSSWFLLSSQSKQPDAAWLWLNWLSSRACHERMVKELNQFSVFPELNTPEYISNPIQVQAYQAMTKYVVWGVNLAVHNPQTAQIVLKTVSPNTSDVLVGIYTGQISDWKQALLDLDSQKQAVLDESIQEAQKSGLNVSLEDFIFPDWDPMKDYITKPSR